MVTDVTFRSAIEMRPVQPDTVEFAYTDFHGERNATAPLTWGQRAMWRSVAEFPDQPVLSLRRILTVPRRVPADVPTVTQAIGMLLARHESLRTRIRPANGQLQQVASAVGRLPLRLVTVPATDTDPDGQSVAGMLADRLGDPPFDHAEEWPLRVGLVVVGDRVRQIVIVFSHATVDAYATEIVLRDLRLLLLRGKLPGGPGLQSVDVALREQQTERWRSDRAVAYWVRQFRLLPAGVFDPVGPALRPRYPRGRLVSAAIDTAARLIAARHRVSTGTVLLAAIAQLVHRSERSGRLRSDHHGQQPVSSGVRQRGRQTEPDRAVPTGPQRPAGLHETAVPRPAGLAGRLPARLLRPSGAGASLRRTGPRLRHRTRSVLLHQRHPATQRCPAQPWAGWTRPCSGPPRRTPGSPGRSRSTDSTGAAVSRWSTHPGRRNC